MKVPKGRRELNFIIDDILVIKTLQVTGVKSLEDSLEGVLGIFERLFETMQDNPYLADGFGYTLGFSKELIALSYGKVDVLEYERKIKGFARQYGVNYTELLFKAVSRVLQPLSELEVFDGDDELAKRTAERGKHPKKMCAKKNEARRLGRLFANLRDIYQNGGEGGRKFEEIYESYSREVRMLRLAETDVSQYPTDIEELKKRFQEKSFFPLVSDYTRPIPGGMGVSS